jgi:hypothetical protein
MKINIKIVEIIIVNPKHPLLFQGWTKPVEL